MTDARLLSFVERLERLQSDKDAITDDMKEVRKEAKSAGYDLPALARLLKRRKLDREEQQEQDALDETYQAAIGMLAGTPLGEASAPKRAEKPVEGDVRPYKGEHIADLAAEQSDGRSKPAPFDSPGLKGAAEEASLETERFRENLLRPDSAAQGVEIAATATRTISGAPPDRIAASLDRLKQQLAATG